MQCHLTTPSLHKTPVGSINPNISQIPKHTTCTMPPRATRAIAADGDEGAAFEAAVKGSVAGALASVIWLATDWNKVVKYLYGTPLQYALANFLFFFTVSLFAKSFFNFMLLVYHLPRRFWYSRIIIGFLLFSCLCGAMYYVISLISA